MTHADRYQQELESAGWRKLPPTEPARCFPFREPETFERDDSKRHRQAFAENMFVALTHPEHLIAFRAFIGASELSRVASLGSADRDALIAAKLRIESFIKE